MQVVFSRHAMERMRERGISVACVLKGVAEGMVVEDYPEETPYPSRLLLAWEGKRPIHLVAAENVPDGVTIIVTVYEPDLVRWMKGFVRRKP